MLTRLRSVLPERRSAPAAVRVERGQWAVLAGLIGAFVAAYITHSFLRFHAYEAKGYDLGIFDQAVRQYAMLKPPMVPVKGVDFHLLGDHFHPILALLAPFYWLWDDPRMLGIIMALALGCSAVPVYLFARRRCGHLVSLLAVAGLLLSWPYQAMVNWDFHEITLGVPIMAWLVWAIDGCRPWTATALAVSLLSVREDMGVTLVAVALVLAIRRHLWPALVTFAAGLLGYWFATSVAIPHFSPTGDFGYWQFTALGPDLPSSLVFILTQPWAAVAVLVDHPLKIGLWLLHFVPLLLLPLLSPLTLMAMPILVSRLFNDRLNVWAPVYQYDAILAPILLMAALEGAVRLGGWLGTRHRPALLTAVSGALLATGLIGTALFPQVFPFHRSATGDLVRTQHGDDLNHAVSLIPDGVCVEAADNAVPHLTERTYVGLHGDIGDELSTWMIIDTKVSELGGWDPLTPEQALRRADRLGFETVWRARDVVVLHHPDRPVAPRCGDYLSR
ncbi:putative membrane protein [Micrococcus cohnii]|uniref:Putative membrane protein n=1 Tax=Micrococcus cohnii TaxID=993416 RepID=A0A7W7M2T2_9MICC|nr:DUF2079 domain-containing protein [Micrococcus cohnii]MBB4735079.1 putative membrane protein [Micrococcus cohnii]